MWVSNSVGAVIQQWYASSDVCQNGICSVTPTTTLASGAHTWWVQTWSPAGYGAWSSAMNFTVQSQGYAAKVLAIPAMVDTVTATFIYDGDGKRVAQTINGVTTYFVGNYYEKTGSTSLVTDNTGNLVIETRYKAWGEVRYATPNQTLPTNFTYTGQYSYADDEATDLGSAGFGLMFYNARWYDPALGRFAQADTVVPGPYNPQNWDRYAYVNNSPTMYIDESGRVPILALVLVGAIVLFGLSADTPQYENNSGNVLIVDIAARGLFDPYDWLRTAQDCYNGNCNASDIAFAALPFLSGGYKKLADLAKLSPGIEKIPGLDTLLTKLNHSSDMVRLGAKGELDYLLAHQDEIAEIGKKFGGGLEMDFVLKDGTFVNVKNYNWKNYNSFTLDREVQNMIDQADKYRQFDPTAIELHFTSKPPQRVIDRLEEASILVDW
jgi:RHS repeat-associated protein